MVDKMVGPSRREYYTRGDERAYIVLNRPDGFPVYKCTRGGAYFVQKYRTLSGARNYMKRNGFF